MKTFESRFASQSSGAQFVETGSGYTPSWTGYLDDKEFEAYERAKTEMAHSRKWGIAYAVGTVIDVGVLVATGGNFVLTALAASAACAAAAEATSYFGSKDDVSDLPVAITRAVKQAGESTSAHPSTPRHPI